MEKLMFLVPDLDKVRALLASLREVGIAEENLSLVANDRIPLDDLPEAAPSERNDFYPALQRGLAVGGASGLVGGLVAMTVPPAGLAIGGAALLGTTALGATFGAWVSAMIGSSVPNSHLREFEDAIDAGQILMLIDVDSDDAERVEQLVRREHPSVEFHGTQDALAPLV